LTNTPIFFTLPSTLSYKVFISTFQALEVPFVQREHMLQFAGWRMLNRDPPPKEEFVVEENVNYKKSTIERAVSADNDTVPASSNLPPPPEEDPKYPATSLSNLQPFSSPRRGQGILHRSS
jgi:hypothetical protein